MTTRTKPPRVCACDCGCEADGEWHFTEPIGCACLALGCPCVTDRPLPLVALLVSAVIRSCAVLGLLLVALGTASPYAYTVRSWTVLTRHQLHVLHLLHLAHLLWLHFLYSG